LERYIEIYRRNEGKLEFLALAVASFSKMEWPSLSEKLQQIVQEASRLALLRRYTDSRVTLNQPGANNYDDRRPNTSESRDISVQVSELCANNWCILKVNRDRVVVLV